MTAGGQTGSGGKQAAHASCSVNRWEGTGSDLRGTVQGRPVRH